MTPATIEYSTNLGQPYLNKCRLPFILYPPAMWENPLGHDFAEQHLGLSETAGDFVLYISIPFCRVQCKACPYFVSILSENDSTNYEESYINALIKDIYHWGSYPRWKNGNLKAIYIGGGTGSIIKTKNLSRLIDAIFEVFPIDKDYSLTLEGNARDFTTDKLDYVANSPINRVSLGVQSFDKKVLEIVGSPHSAESSIITIKGLQERGFFNIQIDMMYNMPGHTIDVWKQDLEMLQQLKVDHFTIYLYRIHEGTPQDFLIKKGVVEPVLDPDSEYVTGMYQEAINYAERLGYRMYMFDHFAKPGFENPYNDFTFKEARDALGIGAGAYSFINSYRTGTSKDIDGYINEVNSGRHMITSVSTHMNDRVRKERYVIFAFQYFFVDFESYQNQFGTGLLEDFEPIIKKLIEKGLVEVSHTQITMTDLGKNWRMNVLLEFINPEFWNEPEAMEQPNWAMNIPMVDLVAKNRDFWLS
jgi:oxygen-independent coproporphyrinogen III oxidase